MDLGGDRRPPRHRYPGGVADPAARTGRGVHLYLAAVAGGAAQAPGGPERRCAGRDRQAAEKARDEVKNYRDYAYVIINEDFKSAVRQLESIVLAERSRTALLDLSVLEQDLTENERERPD